MISPLDEPSVTALLAEASGGNASAMERLVAAVYPELRAIAASHLRRERPGHTLQPTALVHELYLKLVDQRRVDWTDRTHFFAVAAKVMRRILVDHARRRKSEKRGGGVTPVTIGMAVDAAVEESFDVVALDVALENLEKIYPQQARVVELRFYGGLTIDETAQAMAVSPATISREWTMARAWLRRALSASA